MSNSIFRSLRNMILVMGATAISQAKIASQELATGHPERHSNLALLDAMRGGAALYVAAYHTTNVMTASGRHFHDPNGPARMILEGNPLGLLGYGRVAVIVFFVLSGFVIHLRQARKPLERHRQGNWRWAASYLWRRCMRIYPPLTAAVIFTAVSWPVGRALFPDLFGHDLDVFTAEHLVLHPGSLRDALLVLFPTRGTATFGDNGALWSLGYEIWFYGLYLVVILVGVAKLKLRPELGLVVSVLLAVLVESRQDTLSQWIPGGLVLIAIYFPTWMIGCALAELYGRGVRIGDGLKVAMAITGAALFILSAWQSSGDYAPRLDITWALTFALLIGSVILPRNPRFAKRRFLVVFGHTATWSYSLYLVHFPVIMLMYGAVGTRSLAISSPWPVLLTFAATVAVGLLLYVAVERPSVRAISHPPSLKKIKLKQMQLKKTQLKKI